MHGGLCLTAAEGAHAPAVLANCTSSPPVYNRLQVWDDETAIAGMPCIRSCSSGQNHGTGCLNINDGKAACGQAPEDTYVHLFQCPGGAGNRLAWNSTVSAIQWRGADGGPSACGAGTLPRCFVDSLVGADPRATTRVVHVGSCDTEGARGWSRVPTATG